MRINKSILALVISVIIGAGLLAFVFIKYPIREIFSNLGHVTPILLLGYLGVSLLLMLIFTIRWKILLEAQGFKNIPFFDLTSYRIIDYGVSYITPTACKGSYAHAPRNKLQRWAYNSNY
jgi:uncharacterized membrane protein YbhN (UPF0104 family)